MSDRHFHPTLSYFLAGQEIDGEYVVTVPANYSADAVEKIEQMYIVDEANRPLMPTRVVRRA